MTNNDKLKDALKRIESLEEKVDELENACAEHEGWIRRLYQYLNLEGELYETKNTIRV